MPHLEIVHHQPPAPTMLGRLWHTVRSYTQGPLSLKDRELSRKLGWSSGPTAAGVSVNADNAMGVPAVRRAVLAIAGDVGSLPLLVYKRLPQGGKERDSSHRLHRLLHDEANPEQTAVAYREAMTAQAVLLGNAYSEIERDGAGRPVALWPLAAGQCQPERDAAGRLVYRVRNQSGSDVLLPPQDVLHLRGPSYDGLTGLNPLVQSRDAIAIAIATERHVGSFYANNCTFGGTIAHPKTLGDQGSKNLRESIDATHKGADRAHRYLVLEEGMVFTPNGTDPEKSQLQAAREFGVREMGRVFGVPPSRLGDSAQISYATSEQESLQYFATTVRPWLIRWEQLLMSRLLSPAERQTHLIEHNADALLRSDSMSRANFMRTVVAAGVYSRNECRALDNLPPKPGADDLSAPLNTGALPGASSDDKENAA